MYRIWIKVLTRVELFLHADGVCFLGAVVHVILNMGAIRQEGVDMGLWSSWPPNVNGSVHDGPQFETQLLNNLNIQLAPHNVSYLDKGTYSCGAVSAHSLYITPYHNYQLTERLMSYIENIMRGLIIYSIPRPWMYVKLEYDPP
jgi:hypothetical protein